MDDPSAVVAKNDQGVEKLEGRGCDNEHVDRGQVAHVVAQEGAPGRGGYLGRYVHDLPTVAWLTSMPSWSSSPWRRVHLTRVVQTAGQTLAVPILGGLWSAPLGVDRWGL